jgi:hypothetical protein
MKVIKIISDEVDNIRNTLAYVHVSPSSKGTLRDWANEDKGSTAEAKGSNKKNKILQWGKLFSKKVIEFGSFDDSNPCPIECEDDFGLKIPPLKYGIMGENNLLYFERDWVDPEKQEEVECLEIEFWFKCESKEEDRDKLQVLFLSFREEILLGIRKSRVFIKVHNKSISNKTFSRTKITISDSK